MKRITDVEFQQRLKCIGKDVFTNDVYINSRQKMNFYCSQGHCWRARAGSIMYTQSGCPYCAGRDVIKGNNDLWTTRRDVAMLLKNPDEGYELAQYSNKQATFICPKCGAENINLISRVSRQGFSCKLCSDGFSYPEKFLRAVLRQLNVEYIPEYKIGTQRYYYDFFLPQFNTIIETHGMQHKIGWGKVADNAEYQKQNDLNKMIYAKKNNIERYIVIDCMKSDVDFISKNICCSELNDMFDLSVVDWLACDVCANSSLLIKVCDLYKQGYGINEIMSELKISRSTVQVYLRKAERLKWIVWERQDRCPVILLNTKEVFGSITEAATAYNLSATNLSAVCNGLNKYCGLHPITNEPLVWRFVKEYDADVNIDFKSLYNPCTAKLKKQCGNHVVKGV